MRVVWLSLALLLSGAGALLYQLTWQRVLILFAGSDSVSTSLIASLFLAGLGIGSLAGGELTRHLARGQALAGFILCELAAAAWGWQSVEALHWLVSEGLSGVPRTLGTSALVAAAALLPPAAVMGAGFPLLVRAWVPDAERAPRLIGILYGLNTIGGGVASAAGWLAMGQIGFVGTAALAAALNVAAAAIVAATWRSVPDEPASRPSAAAVTAAGGEPGRVWFWCLLFGLSGFIAVSLEIAWVRIAGVSAQYTAYVFGIVLGTFLIADGIGTLGGAWLIDRVGRPLRVFVALQLAAVAYVLLAVTALGALYAFAEFRTAFGLAEPPVGSARLVRLVLVTVALVAVPAVLIGLSFACVQKAVQDDDAKVGRRTAWIQSANILGNAAGGLASGLLFLHLAGSVGTLLVVAALTLLLAGLACLSGQERRGARRVDLLLAVPAAALVVGLVGIPKGDLFWRRMHGAAWMPDTLMKEDRTGVAVLPLADGKGPFFIQGFAQSAIPFWTAHAFLGSIGPLVHPAPKSALVVGIGAGGTPYAAAVRQDLELIHAIEIVSPVNDILHRYAARHPGSAVGAMMADRRMTVLTGDGRKLVAESVARYDVVEADAILPRGSGSNNLYSVEYFRLVRRALAPGGIAVQWAPTQAAVNGFLQVFPHAVLVQPGGVLLGSEAPVPFDAERFRQAVLRPETAERFRMAGIDPHAVAALAGGEIVRWGPDSPRPPGAANRDLWPRDEFALPWRD